ncbi:MAG: DUF5715 family protein [Candidatus Paceibacterota bacterium]
MEGFPGSGSNFRKKVDKLKRNALLMGTLAMPNTTPQPIPKEPTPVVAEALEPQQKAEQKSKKKSKIHKVKSRKIPHPKVSAKGSPAAMNEQFKKSQEADYDRLKNTKEVQQFLRAGILVRISGNENYRLHNVNFPYARPEVKLFVERFSQQYRATCGEQMVVTSLERPIDHQPRNASKISVHPAGMSVDFRISKKKRCREVFERIALQLEAKRVLQYTRERFPPHYHIAVYPEYKTYVNKK